MNRPMQITTGISDDETVYTFELNGEIWTSWFDGDDLECSNTICTDVVLGPCLNPGSDLYVEIVEIVEQTIQLRREL